MNNASGLGFNGFDDKGKQKWDLVKNVNVYGIEVGNLELIVVKRWNFRGCVLI